MVGVKMRACAGNRGMALVAALMVTTALVTPLAVSPALAQQAMAATPKVAQLQGEQDFDIPAQPLTDALVAFGQQSGVQVTVDGTVARSVSAPAVQGIMTSEQALRQLLAGSGLIYTMAGSTVAIERVSQNADGAIVLDPVTVEGRNDPAYEGSFAFGSGSATNVPVPLIETPATVNVMSSDTLERINAQRLEDILQYIPGTAPGATGSSMTNTFTIRGFESSTTRGGSLGSRSNSVYIDGHRPASRRYHFDRSLYERVEVLKGTSSLLYGTASPGGIVSYRSKKPMFEAQNKVSVSAGSFDTRRGSVDLTGPIPDADNVAYRLIATAQQANQTFTGESHDNSYDNRYILNPQLAWKNDSGTRVDLSYEFSQQENVADPGILRFSDGTFGFHGPSLVSDDSFTDQTNNIITGNITHPVTDQWSVFLGGSYGMNSVDALWDSANTRTAPTRNTLLDRDIIRFNTDFEHKEAKAELRGDYSLGGVSNTTTIGFTHRNETYESQRVQRTLRGTISPTNPVFTSVGSLGPYTRSIEWAIEEDGIYLQNFAKVGSKLKVFGGLRYTDVTTSFNADDGNDTSLDYSIGAIFNQNSWLNPFVSYSTSLTPQVGTLNTGGPVPFSMGEQFEVGLKSEWFDDALASTVSVFQIEQTNQIETDPNDRSLSIVTGDQLVRGAELELVGNVTDQLSVVGGYSYLNSEFTTSAQYEGNIPANVPTHKATAMLNYEVPTDIGPLDVGLGYIYVRDRQGDNENSFTLPDYSRVDFNIGWQRDGLDLRLRAENILDEDYVSGSSGVFSNQGLPRSIFLNANFTF